MEEVRKLRALLRDANSIDIYALARSFEYSSKMNKRYKVSFVALISKIDPIILFNEWKYNEFSFSIDSYHNFYEIRLKRIISRSDIAHGNRKVEGSFCIFRYNDTDIWIAFTSDSPDFFENGVVRFMESYKPDISRIYLSSGELRSLFEKLEEKLSSEVIVKKAVLYSHIKEGQINFEKEHFQELFNKAENDDRYVDKIEYHLKKESEIIYHGFISRDLISYYYSGNIYYFFDCFIPLIADRSAIKSEIFENKERSFGNEKIKPINIIFSRNVFRGRADNFRLIKALEKVRRGAVAVYHQNPYLHISFLDFIDGSNFDIFAIDSNEISIIPNFKCSMHSLMRVSEQISKDFDEGQIELSSPPEYSLEDFICDKDNYE
jgi:hypothetical protein